MKLKTYENTINFNPAYDVTQQRFWIGVQQIMGRVFYLREVREMETKKGINLEEKKKEGKQG